MTTSPPPADAPASSPPSPARWLVCGLLLLATTLNYMDRVALNQTINRIRLDIGLTDRQYAALEAGFDIAFGIGTLVAGWLVDRVNVRWVYPVVVAGWSVAGFVTGYADAFLPLLAARFALGLFEAGNWPCGVRTTRTVLPPAERSFGNALFQSGTALGAIITPFVVLACYQRYGADTPGVWAVPFRLIGAIGIGWVVLWLLFAPGRLFPAPTAAGPAPPFWHVFRDRRYWLLAVLVMAINTGWHTVRVWMPRLLKEQHGLTEEQVQWFGVWYYVAADVGSWTVGLLTLWLAARGFDLFRVRRGLFIGCTVLLLAGTSAVPGVGGAGLSVAFWVVGFAALGLFPTYFALSQDVSARHQGKVTASLGAINAAYMASMKWGQGEFVTNTGRFDLLVLVAAWPAVLGCVALLYWPREKSG